MSLPVLDGPRLAPVSGTARLLVVLLHGYGADGNDLIALGRAWQIRFSDAAFFAPNAPEAAPGSAGFQWFALSNLNPEETERGAAAAAPALAAAIDAELTALKLGPEALVLLGFSQGAMMALHVGLRRQRAPAAIVSYSGLLVGPERLAEATARNAKGEPPPILLIHGDQDPVIPLEAMFAAMDDFGQASIPNQWHLAFGVGHGIDAEGLRHGGLFLAQGFGVRQR